MFAIALAGYGVLAGTGVGLGYTPPVQARVLPATFCLHPSRTPRK